MSQDYAIMLKVGYTAGIMESYVVGKCTSENIESAFTNFNKLIERFFQKHDMGVGEYTGFTISRNSHSDVISITLPSSYETVYINPNTVTSVHVIVETNTDRASSQSFRVGHPGRR